MNNNETNEILKGILKWQRLQGADILKRKMKQENLFTDAKEISVYYNSDGEKSLRDLEKITGVGFATVRALWKKWIEVGIAEPTEKYGGGRCKRLFELSELGLEMPKKRAEKVKD